MKKELIKTDNYLLVVDDSEIKTWYYDEYSKKVHHSGGAEYSRNDITKNIVAHLPLNGYGILERVPLLPPIEDDDVWSMGLEARLKELPYTKHLDDGMFNDGQVSGFESGAEWGYNKAREKYKFTEEHAKYLFECGRNFQINADITFTVAREHLLQPKTPTHFEFEVVWHNTYSSETQQYDAQELKIKTTTNSQGQQVACGKYIY